MAEPVPRVTIFDEPGFYLRHPRSGAEAIDFVELKRRGFKSVALNYGDHTSSDWSTIVNRASAAYLTVLPWARCLTNQAVSDLCRQARKMPARAVIVNSEDELVDGRVSPQHIATETLGLDGCVSTLPWLGTPAVNLAALHDHEIHLQLFPQENAVSKQPRDCRAHGYVNAGVKRASFMFGVHQLGPDAFPPRQEPFWIYTLDDCQSTWEEWAPVTIPPLNIPFTGPLAGPSASKPTTKLTGTAKALKMVMHNAGFGNFPKPDRAYNARLERAMRLFQRRVGITPWSGAYGLKSYEAIRRLASATPGETYALTPAAEALIREDVT